MKRSKEAYLDSVHPGITADDVRKEVSWDLKVSRQPQDDASADKKRG